MFKCKFMQNFDRILIYWFFVCNSPFKTSCQHTVKKLFANLVYSVICFFIKKNSIGIRYIHLVCHVILTELIKTKMFILKLIQDWFNMV